MNIGKKAFQFEKILQKLLNDNVDNLPVRFVKWIAYYYPDAVIRKKYLRKIGVELGENSYANLGLILVSGERCSSVKIGRNVSIAPYVTFVCESGPNNGQEISDIPYVRDCLSKWGEIIIEDEVWIGANVTIFPGVTIGRCSIIGAGSVVRSDVEPYSVYAGVPAKKIRDLKIDKNDSN